jgi:hypothetical protein
MVSVTKFNCAARRAPRKLQSFAAAVHAVAKTSSVLSTLKVAAYAGFTGIAASASETIVKAVMSRIKMRENWFMVAPLTRRPLKIYCGWILWHSLR